MKRCCTCGLTKPLEDFYIRDRSTATRQRYCKACKSQYNKTWYAKNREKQKRDAARSRAQRQALAAAFVLEAKQRPCSDCHIEYPPRIMEFDHVTGDKSADISWLVNQGAPLHVIKAEMAKCELVCANCHRYRTFYLRDRT